MKMAEVLDKYLDIRKIIQAVPLKSKPKIRDAPESLTPYYKDVLTSITDFLQQKITIDDLINKTVVFFDLLNIKNSAEAGLWVKEQIEKLYTPLRVEITMEKVAECLVKHDDSKTFFKCLKNGTAI